LKSDSTKFVISEEALSQEVNGETVILDLKSESYFGLDEVGTRIWQLLNKGNTPQQIHDLLLVEYEVDAEQLQKDISELISQLADAGLIYRE
jgi:hypothetical protein